MMNGGYFMIDCKGIDLTLGETPQTILGLYGECVKALSLNKPVVACNCKWGNLNMTPIIVFGVDFTAENYIIFTAATMQIIVTSSNIVTINNLVQSVEG